MVRTVVYHHDREFREQLVDAFRHAGFITYDANDPQHAYQAVWTYRPQVVITDFPAVLDDKDGRRTLTEAIRQAAALQGVAIINLGEIDDVETQQSAAEAGVTRTLPLSTPVEEVIAAVQQVSRHMEAQRS